MAKKPNCAWPGCHRETVTRNGPLCHRDTQRSKVLTKEDPQWEGVWRVHKGGTDTARIARLAQAWDAREAARTVGRPPNPRLNPPVPPATPAPVEPTSDLPRHIREDLWTPEERAIAGVMQMVEKLGADPRLTLAVTRLGEAQRAVAHFVDGTEPAPLEPQDSGAAKVVGLRSVSTEAAGPNPLARPLRSVAHVSDLMAHPGIRPLIELLGLDTDERASLRLDDALSTVIEDLRSYAEGLKVDYEPSTYPELVGQVVELMLARRLVDRIFGGEGELDPGRDTVDEATLEHAHDLVKLSHDQLTDIVDTLEPVDVYLKGDDGHTLYPHQMTALRHPVLLAFLRGQARLLGLAMDYLSPPGDVAYLQSVPLVIPPGAEGPSKDALAQTILDAVLGALPEGTKVVGPVNLCAPLHPSPGAPADPSPTSDPNGDAP